MQYTPLSDDSPNSSEGEKGTTTKSLSSSSCYSDEPTTRNTKSNGSSSLPMIKKITSNIKPKLSSHTQQSLSEPLRCAEDNNDLLFYETTTIGKPKDVEMGTTSSTEDDYDDDDPFYVFKEDLTQKLSCMENSLLRYLAIVQDTDTAMNNHQVKDEKKSLKKSIKQVESTLKDLQMTVLLVEKNPNQFLHIDQVELNRRRVFIQQSSDVVRHVKKEMSSEKIKSKIVQDERALTLRKLGPNNDNHNNTSSETDDFLLNNATNARLMIQQQDETLEELDEAVIRVGDIADQIHDEVTFQNKMLSNLDDDLVDAEEKLGLVMGKLGKLLKTKSKWQICTILLLIVIVIVLFFFILYS